MAVVSNFPLYDILIEEIKTKGPKDRKEEEPDVRKMSTIINSLSPDKMIEVMGIIHHHAIIHGEYTPGKTPYNGKIFDGTKGVKYQIKDFPPELLKILWIFIEGSNFK